MNGDTDGLSGMASVSKADLTIATAEYPNCQQQKPTQTPHSSGDQPVNWWHIDYIEPLPSMQRQHSGFTGIET